MLTHNLVSGTFEKATFQLADSAGGFSAVGLVAAQPLYGGIDGFEKTFFW